MSCNEDKENKRPWRAADGAGPQSAQSYLAEDLSSNLNLLLRLNSMAKANDFVRRNFCYRLLTKIVEENSIGKSKKTRGCPKQLAGKSNVHSKSFILQAPGFGNGRCEDGHVRQERSGGAG
jgi:hypothetical protein